MRQQYDVALDSIANLKPDAQWLNAFNGMAAVAIKAINVLEMHGLANKPKAKTADDVAELVRRGNRNPAPRVIAVGNNAPYPTIYGLQNHSVGRVNLPNGLRGDVHYSERYEEYFVVVNRSVIPEYQLEFNEDSEEYDVTYVADPLPFNAHRYSFRAGNEWLHYPPNDFFGGFVVWADYTRGLLRGINGMNAVKEAAITNYLRGMPQMVGEEAPEVQAAPPVFINHDWQAAGRPLGEWQVQADAEAVPAAPAPEVRDIIREEMLRQAREIMNRPMPAQAFPPAAPPRNRR